MASTTVDPPPLLQLDAILTVDLRLLTQSELYSLSLCSHSSFNSRLCDDVVLPKIDPSVFNESAGSRKQTYSRLRLAPPSSNPIPRGRTLHLRSCTTHPEKEENALIIYLLKQLFTPREEHITDELVRVEYTPHLPNAIIPFGKKRKRARPRKDEYFVVGPIESSEVRGELSVVKENGDREIVNVNGNVVDLVALGRVDNPYGGELRRMTKALKNEEEFLGFLKGLNGRWGSRRKKKRIVDAGEFGDVLPKGWKVMLSVKKKEGHVWLFCRSYIRFLLFGVF